MTVLRFRKEKKLFYLLEISTCQDNMLCTTTYCPHTAAVQSNLFSTHHSCAEQLIVHMPQLVKATNCPHTTAVQNNYCQYSTAVQNNLSATHQSYAKQLIVHKPQLCKTSYCLHTIAVEITLLSTHNRNLFSTVIAADKFVDATFCRSFAQLLHSTRIHRKFRAHVIKLYAFLIR